MSYTIPIHVTQEDIERGERKGCITCPIARAISRSCPGASFRVESSYLFINGGRVKLPLEACEFIFQFDLGRDRDMLPPFTFELSLGGWETYHVARSVGLFL